MSYFEIFAHGESFDPDAYLASTALVFDRKWHKGEYGPNHPLTSGVGRRLGDGSTLTLEEQERIAAEFLSANREPLKRLADYPGIETFILGLEVHTEVAESIVGISFGISPHLMWHALDIGIKPVFYVQFDHHRPMAQVDAANPREMLVSTALFVDADHQDDEAAAFARSEQVGQALRDAARGIANAQSDCRAADVIAYHYLGSEFENAARCHDCGRWATDVNQKGEIDCLSNGFWIDGKFLCDHCRVKNQPRPPTSALSQFNCRVNRL